MNLDIYTTEMSKSIWDKAFFMDKIPGVRYVIDFGCANGAMIRYLAPLFPEITFIGYDINKELIECGRKAQPYYGNVIFTDDPAVIAPFVHNLMKSAPGEICINFSSVLHEVFSFTRGQSTIRTLVTLLQPKFITIRDIYCDDPIPFSGTSWYYKIWNQLPYDKCVQFVDHFPMDNWRDLTHLLMKLQWIDNGWEEEMEENYFSWTLDMLYPIIGAYSPCFEARYQLSYLSEKWREEFNWYNPDVHTHAQFILRRDD